MTSRCRWISDMLGLSLATLAIAGVGLAAAIVLGTLTPETLREPPVRSPG